MDMERLLDLLSVIVLIVVSANAIDWFVYRLFDRPASFLVIQKSQWLNVILWAWIVAVGVTAALVLCDAIPTWSSYALKVAGFILWSACSMILRHARRRLPADVTS